MTPVRVGLLVGSFAVLAVAVWLVFIGPAASPASPSTTDIAVASTPGRTIASTAPDATGRSATASASPAGSFATMSPGASLSALLKQAPPHSVDPAQLTGYVWPLKHSLISSRFAPRAPTEGGFVMIDDVAYHDGLDLVTRCNDKVRAAHDGTVLYAGRNYDPYLGYRGNAQAIYDRLEQLGRTNEQAIVVVVDDGNGYRSEYVHLNRADVEAGTTVRAGDVIGLEGETGFASGCHLHYTLIRMDGGWQQVVPRLLQFGYPPLVRERIDPLDVLPWGDPDAPQRLQDKVNPPSATPTASAEPSTEATQANSPSPSSTPTTN